MPIPEADITAAAEKTYEIGGMHTHTITLTPADFAALEADGMVIVTSSMDNNHEHQVTLSCA
jgi:methylmalonyl-CoA mutase cobalamin-binding subunit